MIKIQRIPMAMLLTVSIVTVSFAGTITGGRTSASVTGTITGGRTGTITGGRTGIIPTQADQAFRGKDQADLFAQVVLLVASLTW